MKYLLLITLFYSTALAAQDWQSISIGKNAEIKHRFKGEESTLHTGEFKYLINGQEIVRGSLLNGKRAGKWVQRYDNGQLFIQAYFDEGLKDNKWTYYYPDGTLKAETYFIANTPYKTWKSYHPNGKVWAVVEYQSPSVPQSISIHDSAGVLLRHRVYTYEQDQVSQRDSVFYLNGSLARYMEFENDQLDGPFVFYYPNGKLNEELVYEKDKLLEVKSCYSSDGKVLQTGDLFNGRGSRYTYNHNGVKLYELNYYDGKLDGEQIGYHINGQQMVSAFYENGKAHGVSKFYSTNGVMRAATEYNYPENKIVVTKGKSITYGERIVNEYDTNWLLTGFVKELDIVGNVLHETPYLYGLKHGKERYYFKTKLSVEHEINYAFGDKVEEEYWYSGGGKVVSSHRYPTFEDEVKFETSWMTPAFEKSTMYRYSINDLVMIRDYFINNASLMKQLTREDQQYFGLEKFGAIKMIDEHSNIPLVNSYYATNHQHVSSFEDELVNDQMGEIYRIDFVPSSLRYQGGVEGFIRQNLVLSDNLHNFDDSGIHALFSVYIDEFGQLTSSGQHKTDIFGVSSGIEKLLEHRPFSMPATVCGLPVMHRSTILYTH